MGASYIEDRILEEWPGTVPSEMWATYDAWSCARMVPGDLHAKGSVYKCVPERTDEGQYPVLTVLLLDASGTLAVSQGGVIYDVFNADWVVETLGGSGLMCRDILGPDSYLASLPEPDMTYFGAVLYWFMEGMPARLDADRNGVPCETLVSPDVVRSVWGGGWVEG